MRSIFLVMFLVVAYTTTLAKPAERLKVVATIPVLASIAKEVGGDLVEVRYLVPPSSDPHQFTLTPKDAELLEECDLFIAIGKEPFLDAIPKDVGRIRLTWDDWLSAGVYVKNGNPHYLWLYPDNAARVAEKISEAMCQLDPVNAEYYIFRLKTFEKTIEQLKEWIDRYVIVSGVKNERVVLAGAHFEPLAEAMNLKVVDVLIKGEGKLPSAEALKQAEEKALKERARLILVLATQKLGDEGRIAEMFAKDTGLTPVYLYGVQFSSYDTYTEYIKYTVASICAAAQSSNVKSIVSRGVSYETCAMIAGVLALVILVETLVVVKR